MWLSLLLAAFEDAVSAEAVRAAQHEVARRLGVGWRKERAAAPPYPGRILQEALEIHRGPGAKVYGQPRYQTENRLRALETFALVVWGLLPPAPSVVGEVRAYFSDVNLDDEASVVRASRRLAPSTPIDGLVGWALDAWRDPNPVLDRIPGVLDQVATSLPSIRDWATETGMNPTRFSWREAQRRSEAWHAQQFKGVRCGEPAPDALVVVRDEEGWTLQRLLTRRDFIVEGGAMGHCVGGPLDADGHPSGESRYIQASRDGLAAFFSVRRPDGIIAATIEVSIHAPPETSSEGLLLPIIVQVQGPEDGPVSSVAQRKIASLFAEAGQPLLPKPWHRRSPLGGVYVTPQADRMPPVSEIPASYADAFVHGEGSRPSFEASIEDGLRMAEDRPGVWGSDIGESTVYYGMTLWFLPKSLRSMREWFGFAIRFVDFSPQTHPNVQFRRSTPETWRSVTGPFQPGIGSLKPNNDFTPMESPSAAILAALGMPVSKAEPSLQPYPDLSDAARARVYVAKLDAFSLASAWTSALSGPG